MPTTMLESMYVTPHIFGVEQQEQWKNNRSIALRQLAWCGVQRCTYVKLLGHQGRIQPWSLGRATLKEHGGLGA